MPLKVGVLSLVMWSVLELPLSVPMAMMAGAAMAVSTVTTKLAEVGPVVPEVPVACAV